MNKTHDFTDFVVQNHGSVAVLQPLSTAAREWIDANVQSEGWQWIGGGLSMEPRYVNTIIGAMNDAGLKGS